MPSISNEVSVPKDLLRWVGVGLAGICLAGFTAVASAVTVESEPNDSMGTPDGFAGSDTLSGSISTDNDVDFWSVNLGAGNSITAQIIETGTISGDFDPVMVLINSSGQSLATAEYNNGAPGGLHVSSDTLTYVASIAGTYFLAVMANQNLPFDSLSNDLADPAWFNATTLDHFSGNGYGAGDYNVAVTVVPVPAAMWLFASGLVGIAGIVRRRKARIV